MKKHLTGVHHKHYLYWILGVFQAVHSAEETATHLYEKFPVVTGAIHRTVAFFPVFRMGADTFAVANILIVALIMGLSPFVFLNKSWALKIATMIAVIETLNGLGHIAAAVVVGGYYPGVVGAVGLLVTATLFLLNRQQSKSQL